MSKNIITPNGVSSNNPAPTLISANNTLNTINIENIINATPNPNIIVNTNIASFRNILCECGVKRKELVEL